MVLIISHLLSTPFFFNMNMEKIVFDLSTKSVFVQLSQIFCVHLWELILLTYYFLCIVLFLLIDCYIFL